MTTSSGLPPGEAEETPRSAPRSSTRISTKEAALMGVMVALAGGLAFLILGDPLSAQEEARPKKTATLCKARHRSDRGSQPIDLGYLEREYSRVEHHLAERMAPAIRVGAGKKVHPTSTRHDAALPACGVGRTRSVKLKPPLPPFFRRKKLWFFDATPGGRIRLPSVVEDDPTAHLFALRVPDFQLLAALKKRLGREISLAPRQLAQAFGVRCMNTLVEISPGGKEAVYHESR